MECFIMNRISRVPRKSWSLLPLLLAIACGAESESQPVLEDAVLGFGDSAIAPDSVESESETPPATLESPAPLRPMHHATPETGHEVCLRPGPGDVKDAVVWSMQGMEDQNLGDAGALPAMAWTWNGDAGVQRSYLEMPIPPPPNSSSDPIIHAELRLSATSYGHSPLDGPNDFWVRRITGPWQENTITWNNQPATSATPAVLAPASTSQHQAYALDVTDLVWNLPMGTTRVGFMLQLATEELYRRVHFASSDHPDENLRPELCVRYDVPLGIGTTKTEGMLVSRHSGKCMDVAWGGTADGTNIHLYTCNGTGAQHFLLNKLDNGAYNIFNPQSGKCVDVDNRSMQSGANVQLYTCNGTTAQEFVMQNAGDGYVSLINTNSAHCVAVDGGQTADASNISQWSCNGLHNQQWKVE